jgi:hypothetical protein
MPTFQECFRTRSSPFSAKESKPTLHEGMELSPSELLDEMTAPMAKSITATVATNNAEELTILLQVKKWNDAINKPVDSFTQHPDTAQTSALVDR